MTNPRNIPEHLASELALTQTICTDFMRGVITLALGNSRDPTFSKNHLLTCIAEDFLETSLALPHLANESIHNVCRRELRFLLEMSIKMCFVQQAAESSTIEEKLASLQRDFNSPTISLRKRINLALLPEGHREAFNEHVGRLYGEASNYVHLTTTQLQRRLELIGNGRKPGVESLEEVAALNQQIHSTLAASFVFVAHAVPPFAVGDFFVAADGSSFKWALATSQFIAFLDEYFDYKHERQETLEKIRRERWVRVAT